MGKDRLSIAGNGGRERDVFNKTSTLRCRMKNKRMVPSRADGSGVQYSAKGYMETKSISWLGS